MAEHNRKMSHLQTQDGLACPSNCSYDGEDRLDARKYTPTGQRRSQGAVETKEGDTTGQIGNVERDPFPGSAEGTTPETFPPNIETKSLDRAFIEDDRTGHYPAARNCIFASPVQDLDNDCELCPKTKVIHEADVKGINIVPDPLPGQEIRYVNEEDVAEIVENFRELKLSQNIRDHFGLTGTYVVDESLKKREGDQELPVQNDEEDCQTTFLHRVNRDMPRRRAIGIARYGTALQPFNGRDFTRDAWEEYLDLGQYVEGLFRERDRMILVLKAVVAARYDSTGGGYQGAANEAESLLRSIGVLGAEDASASPAHKDGEEE